MNRYIDEEKPKHILNNIKYYGKKQGNDFADMITEREAEDVAPTIHGYWYFDETDYITRCSACGRGKWKGYIPSVEEATQWMPFCPQCGARMDENEYEVRR